MSNLKRKINIDKKNYRRTGVFCFMTNEEYSLVCNAMQCMVYDKKCVLYSENSYLPGVYVVLEGIVKQVKYRHPKRPYILNLVTSSEVLGFRSVMTNEMACTTTEVVKEATVMLIPKGVFMKILMSNSYLFKYLMGEACRELNNTQNLILDVTQKNIRARTAQTLIQLKQKFAVACDDSLQIQLSRDEFASVVGTVPETITRVFSEFKKDHLIEVERRYIKLLDVSQLVRIGETCM